MSSPKCSFEELELWENNKKSFPNKKDLCDESLEDIIVDKNSAPT